MNAPSRAAPTSRPAEASLFDRRHAAASLGAIAMITLLAFEALAVAAAMPAIAAALGGWAGYALAFGALAASSVLGMVWGGQASDRHGPGVAAASGLAAFALGLGVCGLARDMQWLAAGRALQGLGSGQLGVALYAGMGRLTPAALHPRMFSMFATAWVMPGLVGPSVAAWLVVHAGWRSVFFVALAVTLPTAWLLLPPFLRLGPTPGGAAQAPAGGARRLALAAAGAAGAVLLNEAGGLAAGRPVRTGLLAAAGAGLVLAAAGGLLPRGSLRAARGLPAVVALRGLIASSFACAEAFVPLHLTRDGGWTLPQAGLALTGGAVAWSLGSAVQARLHGDARRARWLPLGFALVALGTASLALEAALGPRPALAALAWAGCGFGIGFSFPMLSVRLLQLSTPEQQGTQAAGLQLADALASSAVLALAGLGLAQVGGSAGIAGVMGLCALIAATAAWLAPRAAPPGVFRGRPPGA